GGHALFLKDKTLNYVYNFLGIKPEQRFTSGEIAPGKHVLGVEHPRVGREVSRVDRNGQTLRGRQAGRAGPDAGAGREVHAVWRWSVHRPRQRGQREPGLNGPR